MDRCVFLFSAVALMLGLLAYVTASEVTTTAGNGTNFTLNITGQPPINDSVTLIAGSNITLSQSGHNITINSTGGAGTALDNASIVINISQVMNLSGRMDAQNTSINGKVNKSGDTMSGNLEFAYHNLSNITFINQSNTLTVISQGQLPLDFVCPSTACIPRYYAYNNVSTVGNYFVGIRFRGNKTYPKPILKDDQIFQISAAGGYDNTGTVSSTRASIQMRASEDWNATNQGAYFIFWAGANGTSGTGSTVTMYLFDNGSLQLNSLSGSGNGNVCVDANGKLYRANSCL